MSDSQNNKYSKLTEQNLAKLIGKQKESYKKLIDFTESGKRMFTFEGYAGVGKSYCINMFVQQMVDEYDSQICIAAPTHKALRVITQMSDAKGETANIAYYTIHSLLGLKPVIDNKTGEEIFVKDHNSNNRVEDFDYIIVDESSMIDNRLFGYLMEELDEHEIKIIFVGDSKQLPPVNHTFAIPMDEEKRKHFGIDHIQLTEIVRQKENNPIIMLSKEIRERRFKPETKVNDEGHGVIVVPKEQQMEVLTKMFKSKNFNEDQDFCRVVAWTNATVNHYNTIIRKLLHIDEIGEALKEKKNEGYDMKEAMKLISEEFPYYKNGKIDLPNIVVGDTLIADKPIFNYNNSRQIEFQTNEELVVEDLYLEDCIVSHELYTCYMASVRELSKGHRSIIRICHDDSCIKLEAHLNKLRDRAIKEKDNKKRGGLWREYYDLKKSFAELKYAPCLTTYKSQGSTYKNVIIMVNDIARNPKKQELLQHLYVGVTRASDRCFIFM